MFATLFSWLAEALFGTALNLLLAELATRPGLAGLRRLVQGKSPQEAALARALDCAYAQFSARFPKFAGALFDQAFLHSPEVQAELAQLITPSGRPDRHALERLYRAQFSTPLTVDLKAPLDTFLSLLNDAIRAEPDLLPFTNSRALEQLYQLASMAEEQARVQAGLGQTMERIAGLLEARRAPAPLSPGPASPRLERILETAAPVL
jgi:hypothetical protein